MAHAPLLPIYLIYGDDKLKQEVIVNRLKTRIKENDVDMLNFEELSTKTTLSPFQLSDVLNSMPFGGPLRLILIYDFDALKKPLQEMLLEYLKSPCATTILALITSKIEKDLSKKGQEVAKAIFEQAKNSDPNAAISCEQKIGAGLHALVRGYAQTAGVDIAGDAILELIERLGTSTVALNSETKKLATIILTRGQKSISKQDVKTLVSRMVEPKPWDLSRAFCMRNVGLCLRLLNRMDKGSATYLFSNLIAKVREMLSVHVYQYRHESPVKAMKKPYFQIKDAVEGAANYQVQELVKLLKEAPQIDKKMKTGADPMLSLEMWIVGACHRT